MPTVADLERIRSLRQQWFDNTAGLAEAVHTCFDRIGFTQPYVDQLVQDAGTGKYSRKAKVIKDNTWGMIEVDWQSVRLLDCPIVQRLRSVKQLGFSYLTYPSAEHSRFIHSLGMFAVVWRFLDAASRQSSEADDSEPEGIQRYPLTPKERKDLLHAAILHDIGHLPFSHAAESPLTTDRKSFYCGPITVDDFMFSVEETLGKPLQLSESLSLLMILSPRFAEFYSKFVRPGDEDSEMPLRLAALVAGMRPAQNMRGIAQVISSSPIDADKIDYINRDALACGIPVGLDVARLFLRSNFFKVRADKLKKLGIQDISDPNSEEIIFVVNSSGVDTIDELAHSRAALYQRVYLHQTTRNAERLLSLSLESLPDSMTSEPEPLRNALDLLALGDAELLRKLNEHNNDKVSVAGQRIRTRQLPTRACVFGRSLVSSLMPLPEIIPGVSPSEISKQTLGMVVGRLRSDVLQGESIRQLEADILKEAENLASSIRATHPSLVPITTRPNIVTVLAMKELANLTKEAIVLENHELTYSSNRSISDEQNEAADLYKALGYVLTDRDWRETVCLASRLVIAKNYAEPVRSLSLTKRTAEDTQSISMKCAGRLALDQKAITRRAGLKSSLVEQLASAAASSGYFDNVPWLYPASEGEFVALAERLKKFDGQGGWTVSPASCAAFVSQFPQGLRAEFTALMNGLRIIDRDVIRALLVPLVTDLRQNYRKIYVTGFSPDSGSMIRMLLEQEAKQTLEAKGIVVSKDLRSALDEVAADDLLVLCDDVISSGSQAQCQFRSWFGIPREIWPLAHRSELGITTSALEGRYQGLLKRANVYLAFCVGSQAATVGLSDVVRQLGLANFKGVSIGTPLNQARINFSDDLARFLSEVGADLIAYNRFNQTSRAALNQDQANACLADALGYGNAKGFIATYLNVPTCTLTCLWCPGLARGNPWMPLLLRRGYLNNIVIA